MVGIKFSALFLTLMIISSGEHLLWAQQAPRPKSPGPVSNPVQTTVTHSEGPIVPPGGQISIDGLRPKYDVPEEKPEKPYEPDLKPLPGDLEGRDWMVTAKGPGTYIDIEIPGSRANNALSKLGKNCVLKVRKVVPGMRSISPGRAFNLEKVQLLPANSHDITSYRLFLYEGSKAGPVSFIECSIPQELKGKKFSEIVKGSLEQFSLDPVPATEAK